MRGSHRFSAKRTALAPINLIKERELTAERLREILSYDVETGVFRWRIDTVRCCMGDVAGNTSHKRGYRHITIDYRKYLSHRLAWLYVYGKWPIGNLDHINGDTDDNRISNIRVATIQQNCWNKSLRKDNKLGVRNIRRRGNGYRVQILIGRQRVYNKQFKSLEMAIAMRDQQLAAMRGEFRPVGREGG